MRWSVVSVYDSAVVAYNRPFFAPSVGAALRSFTDEVNRSAADNAMFAHPDDFSLWLLAEFDDEAGKFYAMEDTKRVLARGKDVKQNG